MSQGNVEIVRRLYAEDGPFALPLSQEDEQALLDRLFDEVYEERLEVRMPADYPEGEHVFRGQEGMARLIAMLRETWTEFRFEPEGFIDAGDRVAVLIHVVAEGGVSGIPAERNTAHVWGVRDGRLAWIQIYLDRSQALEALGYDSSSCDSLRPGAARVE